MNDDFRVGMRPKTMGIGFALELTAQVGEVIDLAVVCDPHRAIFVAHGHVAIGGEGEDRKTSASQPDVSTIGETPLPEPGVVRAAVRLHGRHPDERLPLAPVSDPAAASHDFTPPLSPPPR